MSSKRKIKHMTSEELKSKLFAHFQKNGSFDQLKTQLRGQLVSELFKVANPVGTDEFPVTSDTGKCLLPMQVCNWLVYDHLLRQDYQYSLSLFVMEACLPYPEKFLTAGDILGLLGLNHRIADSENISKLYSDKNELGHLHSLLSAIIKVLFNVPLKISTLNGHLDTHASDVLRKEDSSNSKEQIQMCPVKSINDSKQCSLERSFLSNSEGKSIETSFHEQLESIKVENEKEIQKLRHKLLIELEKFHEQEIKMQHDIDSAKAELKKEKNKGLKDTQLLKEKESLLEKEIANKYERKIRDIETDFALKFHLKEKELEVLRTKLNEKEQMLASTETELLSERNNQSILKRDLDDIRCMYKIMQDKYSSSLDEHTDLLKKFESMADYKIIKEELASKTQEVHRLQQEIKDIHYRSEAERKKYVETVRNLEDSLSMKEPQLVQSQKELDDVKNTLSKEERMWKRERKHLEQEVNEFKELYRSLMQRVEDQKEDIQDLHRTIHTLNYKFTNNSVNFKRNETLNYKNYQDNTGNARGYKSDTLLIKSAHFHHASSEISNDFTFQFLLDAKNRLGQLKQEEDKVQEKCVHIFSMIPPSNTKSKHHLGSFNSASKNNIQNYNFQTNSKPVLPTSFNVDDWYKNKIASNMNSYSLNDVKQLVTHSLFSHKTNYPTNFQPNIGFLEATHKSTNKVNDWFKSSINVPIAEYEPHLSENETNKEISDNVQNKYAEKLTGIHSEQNKILLPTEQPSTTIQNETLKTSLHRMSPTEGASLNFDVHKEKDEQPLNETIKNNQQTFVGNKSDKTSESIHRQGISLEFLKPLDDSRTHASRTVSVNLDDAWKRRTSNPLILSELNMTNKSRTLKDNSVIFSSPLATPENKSVPDLGNKTFSEKGECPTFPSTTNEGSVVQNTVPDTIKIVSHNPNIQVPLHLDNKKSELEAGFNKTSSNLDQHQTPSLNLEQENLFLNNTKNSVTTQGSRDHDDSASSVEKSNNRSLDHELNVEENHSNVKFDNSGNAHENVQKTNEKNEDSPSDLSEIHLSCGSEPEVQKEDSDAW